MAERRLFTKKITESDAFLDMPLSSQCLYFHLNMNADDDGFVDKPRTIMRMIGAKDNDVRLLIQKNFIITFDSGVVVIKHWLLHNIIRKDRYKETGYKDEKSQLFIKENDVYTLDHKQGKPLLATNGIPSDNQMDTQDKISKDKLSKDNISDIDITTDSSESSVCEKLPKHKYGTFKNVLLTDKEYENIQAKYPNTDDAINFLSEYIEMKGYKSKNHNLSLQKWVFTALKEQEIRKNELNKRQEKLVENETDNPFLRILQSGVLNEQD